MKPLWVMLIESFLLVGMVGCGGPTLHPVKGQVVYKGGADASVLARGMILFDPAEDDMPRISARGEIQEDGSFKMSTPGEGEGVRPGTYRVMLSPPPFFPKKSRDELPPQLLDERFQKFATSGLEITVNGPITDHTFTVEKP